MCQKVMKGVKFAETPLSKNAWEDIDETISPETKGDVHIHCNGSWDFWYIAGKGVLKVAAVYVEGAIINKVEYLEIL